MKVFQIKSKPHGIDRENQFIHDKFICIGWPGIGDLTYSGREEIKEQLQKKYGYEGQKLGYCLGVVNAFVNTMTEGDIVLLSSNKNNLVHIGIVGPYRYEDKYDNNDDGMCHQRDVNWVKVVDQNDLNSKIQELLRNRGTVTQFKYPYEMSELEQLLYGQKERQIKVNVKLEEKSLRILEEALESDNTDHQIKAAMAILQYTK
ncbi:hypothetical protein [Tenuibacillus multivorans]|uniref:Uncharacterized protein n=1 Tax=Tenuibacillus multivorans TaxID=237069 RepID=A0A1G9X6X7_9BACI|nr:hypothetical protein [Tenuibacillus multivorans]GEL78662.1 hypothetical protein TMU01_28970 [Tenuibacillus multivorans]SDM92520.1 hypothetical protein SAMN05216498_1042 [Tenuibacillus multivorans]